MSLDMVELVMDIEKQFGVVFTNDDAVAMRTVGDVHRFLLRHRDLAQEGVCPSSAVFYRARRALCHQLEFDRRSVRPDSVVDDLFPARRRRAHWNRFRDGFAPFALPDLERPAWVRYTLIACVAGLVLPGVLGMFIRPVPPLSWLLVCAGLLFAPVAYWLTLPLAVCIPDRYGTMRGLVRQTLRGDKDQAHADLRRWSEREVWEQLCEIISTNLAVERRLLKPETSFVEDLGCDYYLTLPTSFRVQERMAATIQFDPTSLSKYGHLTLVARTLVEGFLTGVHKSPYKGASVEFAEHRQYYPGDEIRHIDWRAVGKTDRYYIKEYEEETNLKAHLLVDASGSMGFTSKVAPKLGQDVDLAPISKFQYAQYIAASLSYLMLHQRDAVGLALHDTQVRTLIKPKASSKHLLQVIRALEQSAPGGETALSPLWHQVAEQVKQRGLIIILSDCFDEAAGLLKALQHLRHRRHEVLLFHILAPEEIEFPYKKWTQFRNLEVANHKLLVDPQRLRKEYLANFQRFCQDLRDACGKTQVDYQLLRTDEPVDRALGVYLSRRQRQR